MLRINPFEALRPTRGYESQVASVPYDVVNTEEARQLAANNPHSFLHIVRAEIDMPEDTDPYDDQVYTKAKENFQQLIDNNILQREDQPCIYIYRQAWKHHTQVGVVCCCHVDDYHSNLIKKHEKTREKKENDRTRHVLTLNANAGPVFLTFRDEGDVAATMAEDMNARPLYHFVADDDVTHTVWKIENALPYVEAFKNVPCAYVADGHHRAASAARAAAERKNNNPDHTGNEEYNWFLSVLFPSSDLTILPYNRILRDLNGLSNDEFRSKLAAIGNVSETTDAEPDRAGVFCIYLDNTWLRFEVDVNSINVNDPINSLDVALLHDRILGPILDVGDPRTDERLDFVGGIRGTDHLERLVDSGKAAIAASMFPTSIEQLMNVADADLVMPPKSTWFEPKLRSGLLVHSLD